MNDILRYGLGTWWTLFWLGLAGTASLPAQESQVVLLRNGTTLQGRVVREGSYYYVAVDRGEIRLRASQVQRVCSSLEECYRYRLEHLLPGDAQGRLELAQWCAEHGLTAQARRLLDQVQRTHPQHPRVALLRRKLQLAGRRQEGTRPGGQALPGAGPPSSGVYRRHRQQDRQDQMQLGDLSPQVLRRFTVSVHRILQNRCAAGGCHGPGAKNGFRMIRASQGRVSPRVVRHNLVQVLQWIDRHHVDRSVLLHKALIPHGKEGLYQFRGLDKHSAGVLRQWVAQLQLQTEEAQQADHSRQSSAKPPAGQPRTVNGRLFRNRAALARKTQSPETHRPVPATGTAAASAPSPGSIGSGPSPYDPAWFNRRYHSSGRTAGKVLSTAGKPAAGRIDAVSHRRSRQSVDKNKSRTVPGNDQPKKDRRP